MSTLWKFLFFLGLIACGVYLFTWGPLQTYTSPQRLLALLQSARHRWWLPPLFVLLYAVSGLVAFPGSVMTLVGGALFGVGWGSCWNWLGAMLNALAGFLVARFLGRDAAMRLVGNRLARFDQSIERNGFRAIFAMRLVPLFPFNGVNIGAGLTTIRFRDYAAATAIGILPGCIIYTYFAAALLTGSIEARRTSYTHLAIASTLLLLLTTLPRLWTKYRVSKHSKHHAPTG